MYPTGWSQTHGNPDDSHSQRVLGWYAVYTNEGVSDLHDIQN